MRDAFRIAEQEKPGPVHLELPEDIAAEETKGEPFQVITTLLPRADRHTIEKIAKVIQCARYPLLLIASGANRKKICHALY